MYLHHLTSAWLCRALLCAGLVASTCEASPIRRAQAAVTGSKVTISTSLGDVIGSHDTTYGDRFVVPYAEAPVGELRFQDPVAISHLDKYDGSGLPPACPQTSGPAYDEDCLFLTVYRPPGTTATSKLPVFFWIHGGSFLDGATTAYGLDAKYLATKQNIIVVTVQYRLGLLGYLRLDSMGFKGNYGLKDVIQALTYVQSEIKHYGGDASRVTLAGQSSGAEMVKALLVTPSAANLFTRAILHSAPLDFTDHSIELSNTIGETAASVLGCTSADCIKNASIDDLLDAQTTTVNAGHVNAIPGLRGAVSVLRPVVDGTLLPKDFSAVIASGEKLKHPIILSTMKQEGALSIWGLFQSPVPENTFLGMVSSFYPDRAARIIGSGLYDPSQFSGDDATRDALTSFSTDFNWVCPNQQSAVQAAQAGSQVYLAEWDLGQSFTNYTIDYTADKIAHQDDIYVLFLHFDSRAQNYPRSSRWKDILQLETRARWTAFIKDGSPNTDTYGGWSPVETGDKLNLLKLGSNGHGQSELAQTQRSEACAIGSGVYTPAVPA